MRAWISLGSNLGDRLGYLRSGLRSIAKVTELQAISAVYETTPLGPSTSPFFNAVCRVRTSRTALELLRQLQQIELEHGRERTLRWGSRTLDLDFLYADVDEIPITIEHPSLTLPHPRITERDFVLQPWVDVEPSLCVSLQGQPTQRLRAYLDAIQPESRTILNQLAHALGASAPSC